MIDKDTGLDVPHLLQQATTEVFSTMLMIDVVGGEAFAEGSSLGIASNITSMIGLGGSIKGLLCIHFPEKIALKITSDFLGMNVESLNEDVQDAVGEIANMICGCIKDGFTEKSINIELAIPSTIIGKSYKTSGFSKAKKYSLQFTFEDNYFGVDFEFVLNRDN